MTDAFAFQRKGYTKIFFKIFILTLPLLLLLGSYLVLDPFRVLYHYREFNQPLNSIANRDYVSTEMYLNNVKKAKYSSFILGNSRTIAFQIRDWVPYVQDTAAFHYDASGESLYGVWKKLQFVEQHGSAIQNVLLICDASLLAKTKDSEGHLFRKHPQLIGESAINFQLNFVKDYFSGLFFYKYLKYRITGDPTIATALESRRFYYNPATNDLVLNDTNTKIRQDSVEYYRQNMTLREARQRGVSDAVIGAEQLQQLVAIHNIFVRHKTNFQLVISPLYDQRQLNPADIEILEKIFGATRIHDFSGVNEFTAEPGNFYESSHYRPSVGRKILRQIYSPSK